jgi:hypothetical protein
MKITTEQYTTLKLLADDIASARMAPKHLERYHKIVVQDNGQDKVVQKFSPEATRSAILVHMVHSVELGLDPLAGIDTQKVDAKKPIKEKDQAPQEVDVFTAEALAAIPPGKPDAASLKPPEAKINIGDTVIDAEGKKMVVHDEFPRTEGHEWVDQNGRRWKIVDGKKRQQKKLILQ